MFESTLKSILQERQSKGLYRELIVDEGIDFWSNDYLGFANKSSEISKGLCGSGGSRLLAGNHPEHVQAEQFIAEFHDEASALLFNSGYTANLGLLSCIGDRHSVFIYDELCHASIIDGMRLSLASKFKFKHNDLKELETLLGKFQAHQMFVVTESVFSMDGDQAPLCEIAALCKNYGAELIVDEAHALGVFGEKGQGLCPSAFEDFKVLARVYTYGKSLGLHGAAVLSSNLLRTYLINHSRPFIYSTALSPDTALQIIERYKWMEEGDYRNELRQNIQYFKTQVQDKGLGKLLQINDSGIQVAMKGNIEVGDIANAIRRSGIALKAIMAPTVANGSERIRICLHAHNTREEIDKLIDQIGRVKL